jgi:hypothetical protein
MLEQGHHVPTQIACVWMVRVKQKSPIDQAQGESVLASLQRSVCKRMQVREGVAPDTPESLSWQKRGQSFNGGNNRISEDARSLHDVAYRMTTPGDADQVAIGDSGKLGCVPRIEVIGIIEDRSPCALNLVSPLKTVAESRPAVFPFRPDVELRREGDGSIRLQRVGEQDGRVASCTGAICRFGAWELGDGLHIEALPPVITNGLEGQHRIAAPHQEVSAESRAVQIAISQPRECRDYRACAVESIYLNAGKPENRLHA